MCRIFTVLTPFLGLVLALADGALAERPNVVVIMTDDQGVGDFGFAGYQLIDTPHLDALHAGGVHLEEFYVSPVCSPTRACLMTGRYNYRTRCCLLYTSPSPRDATLSRIAG